ncbi:MAG: DUF6034 family protein [Clostridiaceae bacterium]
MKKTILLLLLLAAALLVSACGAAKEAVVVANDSERMIEAAQEGQSGDSEGSESSQTGSTESSESFADGETYVASFHGTTDDFTVNVNAALNLPDTDALPVVRVSTAEFDAETANRFYQLLCGGTDLYTREQLMTKSVLAQEIAKANQMIANGEDTDGYLSNTYLKELQDQYETASDQPGEPAGSVVYQQESTQGLVWDSFEVYSGYPDSASWNGKTFRAQTNREQTSGAEVGAQTSSSLNYSDLSVYPAYEPAVTAVVTGQASAPQGSGLTMTPVEAQRQAEDLLSQAGVTDMRVSAVYLASNLYTLTPGSDPDPRGTTDPKQAVYTYIVSFQRVVNGAAVVSPGPALCSSGAGEDGSAEWWYERLEVQLNENGISRFYWVAPHSVGEVAVQSAELLPFGEIADLFTTMIQVKNEPMVLGKDTYHVASMTLDINEITLSLQRVREKDSVMEGLLVPVWNFWGTQTVVYEDGTTVINENAIGSSTGPTSLLSINAIDGSVIDIQKGY